MKAKQDNAHVQYEKRGQVAYITLNRPDVLNAMNLKMHEELAIIWDDFEADNNIRVGVITGSGEKAFSVGQDLKELANLQCLNTALESSLGSFGKPGWPRLTERFDRAKPLIAKIRGYALGGGFELALACDIIIASEDATFALPEVKLGLIAGAGGIFRLMRQMPSRTALGYLMTGRTMTSTRALELGLLNDVVSNDKLDECVNEWVKDILRAAPLSIQAIKEMESKSGALTLADAFAMQYSSETVRKTSDDAKEGPQAFVEQRLPVWKGR